MSKRIFSEEQVKELLGNKHVTRCSEKSTTYHKDFKLLAIRQYQDEGWSANHIFKEAGFNLDVIGQDTPRYRLRDWLNLWKKKGAESLSKEQRGGPGRRHGLKDLTDKEKLKYLEAQIASLKAENAFLAKLRKKRLN